MALTDKLTAIADAIRGKTGKSDSMTLDQMPTEIAGIQAGGGDNPLDYATSIAYMFRGAVFDAGTELDVTFGTKRVETTTDAGLMHAFNSMLGVKSVKVNCPTRFVNGFSMSYACSGVADLSSTIEIIDLSGMVQPLLISDFGRCFMNLPKLREIRGTFDMSKSPSVSNAFHQGSNAVEEIRFAQGTIYSNIAIGKWGNLSDESIQSIIDGLADMTSGTAQTISLHSDIVAKLTEEQTAQIHAKNWSVG